MKKEQILQAAQEYFAEYGYEGTSLSDIAGAVGLKKQSLYSHFKDKDDIFLSVLKRSQENILTFYHRYYKSANTSNPEHYLYSYLTLLRQTLLDKTSAQRFFLRISFYPPNHLREIIIQAAHNNYAEFDKLFLPIFKQFISQNHFRITDPEKALLSFHFLVNSVILDILYNQCESRIETMWDLYWNGLCAERKI